MVDDRSSRHRHAQQSAARDRRRRMLLIAVGVLAAIVVVLVILSWDRSGGGVNQAGESGTASTTPGSPPATTPAPTPTATATTPDVPPDFVNAMQQIGIPLDPHTGWVLSQGICVRLGQPDRYNQFAMAEGIERLFPSVSDEQSHAFVAMVAASVCHL
jgi:hypothetical protein